MSRQSELAQLGRVFDTSALSNRNMLINGDLSVWQRGTSATYSTNTGRGYVADRWYAEGYPLNMTITKSTIDYDDITYSSAALTGMSGNWSFLQAIENGYTYNKGKTLTFSFVASGSGTIQPVTWIGSVATQFFGGAITLTSTPTRYEITHNITNSGTGAELYIGFNATGGTMNVSLLQLERGDTATPFEHRSYGDELARCRRFFWAQVPKGEAGGAAGNPAQYVIADGGYLGSSQVEMHVQFPVEMRASPSSFVSSGTDYFVAESLGGNDYFDTLNGWGAKRQSSLMYSSGGAVSGTGGQYARIAAVNSNAYVYWDAEL